MTYDPGFNGGQCVTKYRVISYTDVYYWGRPDFSIPPPYLHCNYGSNGVIGGPPDGTGNTIEVDGPIASITIETKSAPESVDVLNFCGNSQYQAKIIHGDNQTTLMSLNLPRGGTIFDYYQPIGRNTRFTVQRVDGNPDNCGNPTPNQHPCNPDDQMPCCGCAKPLL
jgi:hypothetical protein